MIEVLTLGRLEIRLQTTGTSVVISQPKRAALLAYLAVAEPRGLQRRDTLLALLWPDLDQAKARAALNQALYALRQSLGVGDDVIVSSGEGEVGLDWEQVQCDAVTLREALTGGRWEDALTVYRGPLLAGFHVSGTPEFERWLDTERARLHEQVSEAAWSLTEVETDPTQAARLARQAAAFSPEDETVARRLISFLIDRDDRAGAFRAYRAFADHLRREYGTEPSQETHALIADLEATGETAALGGQATDASESSVAVAWPDSIAAPTPDRHPRPVGWLGRLLANPVYLLAAVGAIAIAAVALGIARMGDKLLPPMPRSFVVFPFSVTGDDTTLAWLATGAATMLTHDLEAWSEVRVLDPRRIAALADSLDVAVSPDMDLGDALRLARVGRVETAVLGEIVGHAGTLEIVLRQYDGQSGNQVGQSERVAGAADEDVRILIDGLAARVLGLKGVGNVTPDLRAATTASLDAYRNYLEGLAHLYSWQLDDAAERFRTAVDLDSTFALAYHRLALAEAWREDPIHHADEWRKLSAAAVRHADRLTWRARQHVLAQNAFYHDDFMLARQLYGDLIAADSSDAEAWFFLANVEVSDHAAVRNSNGRFVPRGNWNLAFEGFQRAVELDPRFQLGYGVLFEILLEVNRGAYTYFEPVRDAVDDEKLVLEGLVYFYPAWRDSILWIPIVGNAGPIIQQYRSDSVVDILREKAMRLARRWSNAAPDESRPHEVLRDLWMERSAYGRALDEHRALLGVSADTTPVGQIELGLLYLATSVYDTAVAVTEEGLALLHERGGGAQNRPPTYAANVFIAQGQPSRAFEIVIQSRPEGDQWWVQTKGGGLDFSESKPLLWRLGILGSTGASGLELRAALDSLTRMWEKAYTPTELETLYRTRFIEVAPAFLLLDDEALRDWFRRARDSVSAPGVAFQAWRSLVQFRAESLSVATRSFDAAVDSMSRPDVADDAGPFDLYLMAHLAQALGRHSVAADFYARMDSSNYFFTHMDHLSYWGSPNPDWGLLSLSYLQRAQSYEVLGDIERAVQNYERFLRVWEDAEPDLQHYADKARQGLGRLRGERR